MLFKPRATATELWAFFSSLESAKKQSVPPRSFHSLTFRISGRVQIEHDGELYISETDCITFMPKGISYTTEVLENTEMLTLHFTTSIEYQGLKPMIVRVGDRDKFNRLFKELVDKYRASGETTYGCMSLLYRIFDEVDAELSPPIDRIMPVRIRKAKEYIDSNFNDPITVAFLAESAGISEVYFRSEFKKYVGTSPVAYIKNVRIENSKVLLRSGYYSVSDVATRCGFDSISYFSYEFRRITGVTPSDYIKNMGEEVFEKYNGISYM